MTTAADDLVGRLLSDWQVGMRSDEPMMLALGVGSSSKYGCGDRDLGVVWLDGHGDTFSTWSLIETDSSSPAFTDSDGRVVSWIDAFLSLGISAGDPDGEPCAI